MDHQAIERLLDKYFEGATSREEEKQLRAFFRRPEVPAALQPYQPLFRHFDAEQQLELADDFDERLLARLDERPAARTRRLLLVLARVAAVLLLAFGLWWLSPSPTPAAPPPTAIDWSQYEPDSPEEAYRVMRLALLKTSGELNEGAKTAAEEIDRLDEVGRFFK